MFATTHIALPVMAAQGLNLRSIIKGSKPLFNRWHFTAIGICGMMPDIVHPHLDLLSRYSSWSHSGWFFLGWLAASLILDRFIPNKHRLTVHLCWFAVLLHIFCDLISGGVNLFPPYSEISGGYWITPMVWLYSDLFCIISVYLLHVITRNKLHKSTTLRLPREGEGRVGEAPAEPPAPHSEAT